MIYHLEIFKNIEMTNTDLASKFKELKPTNVAKIKGNLFDTLENYDFSKIKKGQLLYIKEASDYPNNKSKSTKYNFKKRYFVEINKNLIITKNKTGVTECFRKKDPKQILNIRGLN
jgi:hypothetical protein